MRKGRVGCAALTALLLAFAPPILVDAHPVQFTTLQVRVQSDGEFEAVLNIDILAFALHKTSQQATNDEMQALLDGPRATLGADLADAGQHFKHEVVVRTDAGDAVVSSWSLPGLREVDAVLALGLHPSILMPGEIRFSGNLPFQAKTLSIRLPYVLGDTIHVYELPHGESSDQPVSAGSYATAVPIALQPPSAFDRLRTLSRYVVVGIHHIIPEGLDHILFVLGLFLLSTRLASLLWQVSAFTVAHSITLGLSIYGVIRLPPSITEPLIAASIVVIAVENIYTGELKPWRPFVVFGFGLIHGLGFASAFAQVGLPRQNYFIGLIGFNLGVECGQLIVILAAFLMVGWFRKRPWYRRRIVIPASCAIAFVASIWTVQRIFWPA
jgi:hypothetical protein